VEDELRVRYGRGRTIFIEHMNDLFAKEVPGAWILDILDHCWKYPENTYVFQTKNPSRIPRLSAPVPPGSIIGTTIETNRPIPCSLAPLTTSRASALGDIGLQGYRTFLTIEPILDFDVDPLAEMVIGVKPEFINIGADSKGCGLPEPSAEKVASLISSLQDAGVVIRKKVNLGRLLR